MDPLPRLVLASASPRRAELLEKLGLRFEVRPADIDETPYPDEDPSGHVQRLAAAKAAAGDAAGAAGAVVIAADTIVAIDGLILGKPRDRADAERMLRLLSGREHLVATGVSILVPDAVSGPRAHTRVDAIPVRFRDLSDAEIDWYLDTGESLGKAGAYGMQGAGGFLVATMTGNYHTAAGLPLTVVQEMLRSVGHDLLAWARPAVNGESGAHR
jgi:septum formation protein